MRNIYLTLFVVALFTTSLCYSQETQKKKPRTFGCYFDQYLGSMMEKDPSMREQMENINSEVLELTEAMRRNPNYTLKTLNSPPTQNVIVPVVITIIHGGTSTPENISDDQAVSQIEALNDYFSGYGMQFCLATLDRNGNAIAGTTPGIRRVQNSGLTHLDVATEMGNLNQQSASFPTGSYLNIYVVNEIIDPEGANGGIIAGLSSMPGSITNFDGIVVRYDAFGDASNPLCTSCSLAAETQQGKTLVHEAGHYFGLYHTFTQGCLELTQGDCHSHGDRVCDTPPVAQQNSGCPTFVDSCDDISGLPDAINNYMDYTNENCRNDFTQGQYDRMLAFINIYRSLLVSVENLGNVGVACNPGIPPLLLTSFSADTYAPCAGTSLQFSAPTISGATYAWDFGDGSSSSAEDPSHSFTYSATPYTVTLTITVGTDSASISKYIYPVNCSPINNVDTNWLFSNRSAISFQSGTPVQSTITNTTSLNTFTESCAVQSDASGQLLFYTNGIRVFNSSQTPINNSNLLLGNASAKNGVLIVPDPGNSDNYYIFTKDNEDGADGFRYTLVTMSGTTPVLSSINTPVTIPAGYLTGNNGAVRGSEGITAIASCDGGYWIIMGLRKPDNSRFIVVYSLDQNGLSFNSEIAAPLDFQSSIKASPDGNHIVKCGPNSTFYLYDFDKHTGTVSNERNLSISGGGVSFSPDSKLMYAGGNPNYPHRRLYQYNLESTDIVATRKQIAGNFYTGDFQLGPDNKIYIGMRNSNRLAVIHSPNTIATDEAPNACQFSLDGPLVQTTFTSALPNLINAKAETVYDNSITIQPIGCNQYMFTANVCTDTFSWNFGDPGSGANNTSTLSNPTHSFYGGDGNYTISLTAGGTTIYKTLTIEAPEAVIYGGTTACVTGNNVTNHSVIVNGDVQSIEWGIANGSGSIEGLPNSPDISVTWTSLPGVINVWVVDALGCDTKHSVTVTSYCEGDECAENIVFQVPETATLETYNVSNSITTQNNYQVDANSDITLTAGSFIQINPNSWIKEDAVFLAKIENCPQPRPALGEEEFTQNELILYPNPTDGLIHLSSSSYITEASIYDISGKEIYTFKFDSLPNVEFDISNLQRGLYLVKVSDGENSKTFKVIKQ